jgi:hypothetical protein
MKRFDDKSDIRFTVFGNFVKPLIKMWKDVNYCSHISKSDIIDEVIKEVLNIPNQIANYFS